MRVGFALESENLEENARDKLARKKLDMIVANSVGAGGGVFGSDRNEVIILDSAGRQSCVALAFKEEVAHRILDQVALLLKERSGDARQGKTRK